MVSAYLIFIISFIMIRFIAGYDSRFQKGRCLTVNNPVIRAILMDRMSFFERTNRRKEDIPKMSVCGVIFYAAAFIVLMINLVLLAVPQIPIQPWEMGAGRFFVSVDSLNEKVSALSIFPLFMSLIVYVSIALFGALKQITPKWMRVVLYVVTVMMLLTASAEFIYFLTELLSCFV